MSKRPLVVDLIGPVPPPTGGIATHVAALVNGVSTAGAEVRVHSPHAGAIGRASARVGAGAGWALLSQLATSLSRGALVHGHSVFTAYPGFGLLDAFVRLMGLKQARWIETIHDGRLPDRFATWPPDQRRRYVRALAKADKVVAVSPAIGRFLMDAGLKADAVEVVGPLLPTTGGPGPGAVLEPAFFDAHEPVLLGVGAMIPLYDFDTLVTAFETLRATSSDAGLTLLNSTFARDAVFSEGLYGRLRSFVRDALVLTDVTSAEARTLMARADVVVRGPAQESYGLSRVEAMLVGTPVVGTPVGEQAFVHLYKHGDADSMSNAIHDALDADPDQVAEASVYFGELAQSNLTRLVELYEGRTP